MNCRISCLLSPIGFLVILGCLLPCTQAIADSSSPLTLSYSGEEQGLLGLHGCGTEQVGGLARRHTVIKSLREEHPHALNLHTGNILNSTNPNNELIYQIALEALSGMDYDALCLGPQDLSLPTDTLSALHGNHPDLPIICTNLSVSAPTPFAPYIIHNTAAQIEVAVISLISQSYQAEITAYNPSITLSDPAEALEALSKETIGKSDIVVGVFHGETFAAAVFVTYLLLGMGLLKFLSFLNEFSIVAKCVYLLAAVGTFALAFLSLYDTPKDKPVH